MAEASNSLQHARSISPCHAGGNLENYSLTSLHFSFQDPLFSRGVRSIIEISRLSPLLYYLPYSRVYLHSINRTMISFIGLPRFSTAKGMNSKEAGSNCTEV
jgi:hypothetical protein